MLFWEYQLKLFVLVQKPSSPWSSVITSSIHVSEFLEPWSPVVQVIIVLLTAATGGIQGAQGPSGGATAFIVKDQEGVVRRGCGVIVSSFKALQDQRKKKRVKWGVPFRQTTSRIKHFLVNFHLQTTLWQQKWVLSGKVEGTLAKEAKSWNRRDVTGENVWQMAEVNRGIL